MAQFEYHIAYLPFDPGSPENVEHINKLVQIGNWELVCAAIHTHWKRQGTVSLPRFDQVLYFKRPLKTE